MPSKSAHFDALDLLLMIFCPRYWSLTNLTGISTSHVDPPGVYTVTGLLLPQSLSQSVAQSISHCQYASHIVI